MKQYSFLIVPCIIALVVIFIVSGCSGGFNPAVKAAGDQTAAAVPTSQANTISPVVFFPVQQKGYEVLPYPAALAKGTLVLDNGYLRLAPSTGTLAPGKGSLIIWPPGSTLQVEGNDIRVINPEGICIAAVGEPLNVGGGQISTEIALKYTGQVIPQSCAGPYWLASPGVYNAPFISLP